MIRDERFDFVEPRRLLDVFLQRLEHGVGGRLEGGHLQKNREMEKLKEEVASCSERSKLSENG